MTSSPLFEICRNFSTVFEGECKNGQHANISPKKKNWPGLKVNIKFAGDGRRFSIKKQRLLLVVKCLYQKNKVMSKFSMFYKPFFLQFFALKDNFCRRKYLRGLPWQHHCWWAEYSSGRCLCGGFLALQDAGDLVTPWYFYYQFLFIVFINS